MREMVESNEYPYRSIGILAQRLGKSTVGSLSCQTKIRGRHGYVAFATFMMVKAPNRPKLLAEIRDILKSAG